jgi:hypothetical protein
MSRRSTATLSTLLGAALTVALVAGCGSATTTAAPTPTSPPAGSPSSGPSLSASSAGSIAPSGSPAAPSSAVPSQSAPACESGGLGLAHVAASLEDLLPSTIGGVCLEKFSLVLSAYISSPPTGGDKNLYAPWLLKFGKTTDDVNLAVTADLSQPPKVNFNVHAIQVPGATAAALASSFGDAARAAGWPVSSHANYLPGKSLLEITNPATSHMGYVYAKNDVLYTVITDDQALLTEALVKLP